MRCRIRSESADLILSYLLMDVRIVQVIQLTILGDSVIERYDCCAALDEACSGLGVLDELELGVSDADGLSEPNRVDV